MKYIYGELAKNNNVTLYTPSFNDAFLAPILSFNYKDYPSEKQPLFWLIRILHAVQAFIVQSLLILHLVLTIEELYV